MADDGAAGTTTTGYPRHWEADVVLRDGATAHVRPITPDDADALQSFHVRQSERSTYFRFFAPLERLPPRDLERFTRVDHVDRVALVALVQVDDEERIVAVARYDRVAPREAEVAFNVSDEHHGRGLASVLLEHLTAAARERGITRFVADVLPQNGQMLAVFREAGYVLAQTMEDGIVSVSFSIDPTDRSRAVMADREHRAEARSVHGLLTPSSVLVVLGDGPDPALGAAALSHLATGADRPTVHVAPVVDGRTGTVPPGGDALWPSLEQVPGTVDLLVLVCAADDAPDVVRRCAHLRPHAVVVLSGGFAEQGAEGAELQRRLVRAAHGAGMRLLGPGSFGFVRQQWAGHPAVNASLADHLPLPGRVGLFCQSAPLAVGLLASAERRGLGLSTFVSAGNRADVSGNDAMQFWAQDDATDVVALYLESIGNPRKFARVARRLAATKPVVVLAAGRSGHVVPPGHVVRRTRVPRRALDELLAQAGVVRAENAHQLLDVTQLLAHQPLPAGRRVAIVASSPPLAALVAEAAASAGLTVAEQVTVALDEPDDVVARLAEAYARPDADAVVVVLVPTVGEVDPAVRRAVAEAAAASGRTTVARVLGCTGVCDELTAPGPDGTPRTVPAYAAAEDGVQALAAAARYAAWRTADHGATLDPADVDRPAARRLVESALVGAGDDEVVPLAQDAAAELLAAYGLQVWPVHRVADPDEAVAAAEVLGWPVALKASAGQLRHRIDLGGVRLDVPDASALVQAMAQMRERLAALGERDLTFEVQRMAPGGAACVVRTTEDPRFGPVVAFGLAGDAVDLLGDISYRVAPLTDADVREMVRSVRASPRLFGYRGLPDLDVRALEDVVGRVAVLTDDLPEVHSLELHPVVVSTEGAAVLSVRVELARTTTAFRTDSGRRVLPR